MEYGYARASTKEQNEERQLIALRAAGLHNHQIFLDKQSGKDFNRCQYQRLLRRLKRGGHAYHKKHRPFGTQLS